ncbi:MAG: ribonuclease III [Acidobacteria bacterium]|nr:ribonuclease III [Acidobacteriota bacterium]
MAPRVVFTTQSDIEASVIVALLDSHGIPSFRISGNPQAIWPMTVNSLGDVQIAVAEEVADDALNVIAGHRTETRARVVPLRDEFEEIEHRVGHRFKDRGLLEHALTHKSRAAEDASGGVVDNESMEFLGDAVLGLVVADMLFHAYPHFDEGQKSKIKASVVSTPALARRAEDMELGVHLLLGRGEEKTGGRFKQALLADAYEALIAAVYLDGGLSAATAFLERELSASIEESAGQSIVGEDYKSALQERVQALGQPLPEYRVAAESGPDHRKVFTVEVLVSGETLGSATGKSKKVAEQDAAKQALATLG